MLKSCAKASIGIESNSYEYGGRLDRHSMRLYYTCAHSGEVLLLGLASAQTILVDNRPAERDDSRAASHYVPRLRNCNRHCSTRCQSPLDTSIATGLLFIALPPKGNDISRSRVLPPQSRTTLIFFSRRLFE